METDLRKTSLKMRDIEQLIQKHATIKNSGLMSIDSWKAKDEELKADYYKTKIHFYDLQLSQFSTSKENFIKHYNSGFFWKSKEIY